MKLYDWLRFDEHENIFCLVCREAGKFNSLAIGTNNFRSTTLTRHLGIRPKKGKDGKTVKVETESCDHKEALSSKTMATTFEDMQTRVPTSKEKGIVVAINAVYW